MTDRDRGESGALSLDLLYRALRRVRRLGDSTLHTFRRRRARRLVAKAPKTASLLFICQGNICRSPYAAAAFEKAMLLRGRNTYRTSSAGFIGPNRGSPAEAVAVAEARGHDLRAHRSRLMTTTDLRQTDVIVVMDADQQRAIAGRSGRPRSDVLVLGDLDPRSVERRTIRDPWGQPPEVFEAVYGRIDRCVGELARLLDRS